MITSNTLALNESAYRTISGLPKKKTTVLIHRKLMENNFETKKYIDNHSSGGPYRGFECCVGRENQNSDWSPIDVY